LLPLFLEIKIELLINRYIKENCFVNNINSNKTPPKKLTKHSPKNPSMKNLTQLSKLFALMILFVVVLGLPQAQAQHVARKSSFDGFWIGELSQGDDTNLVIIGIKNGEAQRYYYDEDEDDFFPGEFFDESTLIAGNNVSYTWVNKGGIWSETQTHLMDYLRPNLLYCILVRQVNNASEDEDYPGMNNEWSSTYEGTLDRYNTIQEYLDE